MEREIALIGFSAMVKVNDNVAQVPKTTCLEHPVIGNGLNKLYKDIAQNVKHFHGARPINP